MNYKNNDVIGLIIGVAILLFIFVALPWLFGQVNSGSNNNVNRQQDASDMVNREREYDKYIEQQQEDAIMEAQAEELERLQEEAFEAQHADEWQMEEDAMDYYCIHTGNCL